MVWAVPASYLSVQWLTRVKTDYGMRDVLEKFRLDEVVVVNNNYDSRRPNVEHSIKENVQTYLNPANVALCPNISRSAVRSTGPF